MVQFVSAIKGGDVAPEPPAVSMRKRLRSEVTVPFHPTRRYTAFQRQPGAGDSAAMKLSCLLLIGPALAFAADDPYAAALFQKNCATCHQAGGEAAARIPQISVL